MARPKPPLSIHTMMRRKIRCLPPPVITHRFRYEPVVLLIFNAFLDHTLIVSVIYKSQLVLASAFLMSVSAEEVETQH